MIVNTICQRLKAHNLVWKGAFLQVVSIPYFTWATWDTATEQQAYLRKFFIENGVKFSQQGKSEASVDDIEVNVGTKANAAWELQLIAQIP